MKGCATLIGCPAFATKAIHASAIQPATPIDKRHYMGVLNMQRGGDAKATLHKIYVGAAETYELVVVFGDWGLVKKELTLMPEGIP